ncbi:MAG TPA: type IV secretory system conjugative DNA transfer family protein [Smithella sp.]|nr:type IV secretory system conjugative DNA transfer family protein [Smithella sp.]
MSKIVIGTKGEGFDLDTLLSTRLLLYANSGGGKSYLIRKLVEESFNKVPILIIDPEGEFATLREKYPFVLVGSNGETPADYRSAELLVNKLLELHASAIIDIYELRPDERHRYVAAFLSALIEAPKKLWQSVLIIVDEAHLFAPEKGQGESAALTPMTDLATRGRKRGYCAVMATQRLSKLSKNVSAELQNVMIGSTFLDIDRERAVDALGISRADKSEFMHELKMMEPGTFIALGRAISKDRLKLKVAEVKTSHPKSGQRVNVNNIPTPDKIRALLPQLSDLPQEAAAKAKTVDDLKAEIVHLKKELAKQSTLQKVVEKPIISDDQVKKFEKVATELNGGFESLSYSITHLRSEISGLMLAVKKTGSQTVLPPKSAIAPKTIPIIASISPTSNFSLGKAERKILTALAQYPAGRTKVQIALLSGYAHSGGSFNNALSSCRTKGLMVQNGDCYTITEQGLAELGHFTPLPEGHELLQYWIGQVGKAERLIIETLAKSGEMTKKDIGEATGYEPSGGSFNNALSRLRTLELIKGRDMISLSEDLR